MHVATIDLSSVQPATEPGGMGMAFDKSWQGNPLMQVNDLGVRAPEPAQAGYIPHINDPAATDG